MLEPLRDILVSKKIILASSSPSRREAMKNIGLDVDLITPDVDETLDKTSNTPDEYVKIIALRKIAGAEAQLKKGDRKYDLLIAADTVVSVDGNIFCKPETNLEAYDTLRSLSGRVNHVTTGMALKEPDKEPIVFTDTTHVQFQKMSDREINAYIATGEPKKYAGGYAIQGKAGTFIEKINGNYFNVLGLPVHKMCLQIRDIFEQK